MRALTRRIARRHLLTAIIASAIAVPMTVAASGCSNTHGPITEGAASDAASASTDTGAPTNEAHDGAALDPLGVVLARKVAERSLVGCTAALRSADRAWSGAAGLADRDRGIALTAETPLRVGSITKSLTAAVVMSLVDEGALDLDAAVTTYLPDVHGATRYTVRHLLAHRTGLVPYQSTSAFATKGGFGDPSRSWTPRELVALVEDLPLAFVPGTQLAYSNTNFILAGMIAEAASKTPIHVALRDRVYAKAGMPRTWLDGAEAIPADLARGYSTRFDASGHLLDAPGPLTDVTAALNPTVAWTAGAVVSTAPQIASFYQALLTKKIVSVESTAAMTTSAAPPGVSPAYGLGLWRYGSGASTGWGHTGDTAGYRAFAAATADGAVAVSVLCNDDRDEAGPQMIAEALLTTPR